MTANLAGTTGDAVTAARQAWEQSRDTAGPEHISTLDALQQLALAHRNAGRLDAAVTDMATVVEAAHRTIGPYAAYTLRAAWRLAYWSYLPGDTETLPALRELVPLLAAVVGPDDPDVLLAQHALASVEDTVDAPDRRLLRWVQLCAADARTLGYWHELTMSAAYGAARARRDLGDLFGASHDMVAVYNHRIQTLGERHLDTLTSQLWKVSWVAEAAGLQPDTLSDLDFLIPALQAVAGPDDYHTLVARYNRALWTPDGGSEVIDLYSDWEVLAEDLARARGPHDPLSLGAAAKRDEVRIKWHSYLDEFRQIAYDLSLDMFEDDDEDAEDDEDADDGPAENEYAADAADEERSDAADKMANAIAVKRALSHSMRADGAESLATLTLRYYQAFLYWQGHEFETAARRTTALIDDCIRILGEEHPLVPASRELLSHIQCRTWGGVPPYWDGSVTVEEFRNRPADTP